MSRPTAGNYIIYNRVLSPTGQKLAITFQGENQFATVESFGHVKNQIVRNPSPLMSLHLLSTLSLLVLIVTGTCSGRSRTMTPTLKRLSPWRQPVFKLPGVTRV
jgi:hypothetical protein